MNENYRPTWPVIGGILEVAGSRVSLSVNISEMVQDSNTVTTDY